ncbi:MAG: hypothetical protein AB7K24_20770 [Gemmataceae bacterium]
MPLWLVEDPSTVYLILALIALGLVATWFFTKLAKYLLAVAVVGLVALGVMLIDYLIVSTHERIENHLVYMAEKAAVPDLDEVFKFVARDFDYGGMNRERFRGHAQGRLHGYKIDEMVLWDFRPEGIKDGVAIITFNAKVKGDWSRGAEFFFVRAQFVKEDGDWKMKGFRLYDPMHESNEITLP